MKHYTLNAALNVIRSYCPSKFGFDEAFSDISPEYLLALVNLIIHPEMHNGIFFKPYDEVADFLDGNGFKVEGSEKYGYTITLLKT